MKMNIEIIFKLLENRVQLEVLDLNKVIRFIAILIKCDVFILIVTTEMLKLVKIN